MTVYIILHQTPGSSSQDGLQYPDDLEIVGAYRDPKKALTSFEFYLDQLEKVWREDSGSIDSSNTFNRFSEPTDLTLANADTGDGYGNPSHSVWIAIQAIE